VEWSKPLPAIASLIAAGKKIILLTGSGELMTVTASPGKCDVLSRVQVLGGRCWTPPVLSDARLYCRNAQGLLVCLDVGVQVPAAKSVLAEFPLEGDEGTIFVQAKVNQAGPFRFILDTGAYESLVDTRAATKAGLRLEGVQRIGGAGGSETGTSVRDIKLSLPGFQLLTARMDALPLDALSARHGLEVSGILGAELFSRNVVEIDYEKKAIRLYEPSRFNYQGRGERIPITIERNVPHARATFELPGLEPIEGEFTIDTGSSASLILTPPFVTEHDLLKRVSKKVLTYGRGVGSEIEMTVSRAKVLQLGGISLSNCLTLLPERGQYGGPTGNVGSRLLRRFRVIFDYVHQEMILEPNNLFSLPEEFDMSGLALVAESGGFRVEHVLPNSPAAEAGIQPGDLIEGVNDRLTVGMGIAELRELFRRADSEYDLAVRRGGETNKTHLRLRRLI
jgi:hypothetical protein